MHSKEEISLSKVKEVVVPDATQNELDLIKKKNRAQLELLKQQAERLKLFDANIDIDFAINWHEIKSSQFSKLAYFYGQKGWVDRQVLHGVAIAGAMVLGLAVHVLAFFIVIAAYYKLSEMLLEHYKVEEDNKEEIRKSFAALGEGLRQSIESFNEMERKLDTAFTTLEEQNQNLSATIALLGLEAGKLHGQVVILEGMVKQLQEQQKKVLAATDKISGSGEKLSKEIEFISTVILERKVALDCISETIVSVAKETVLVKNQIAQTSVGVKEESEITKEQYKKCDSLDASIDNSSAMQAFISLRKSIDRCKQEDSDDDEIILNAQRAIAFSKASSQRKKPEDTPSNASVVCY